jgi:hypothetical protein
MTLPKRTEVTAPDGVQYTVSTINRECSALAVYGKVYSETIVFGPPGDPHPDGQRYPSIEWQSEAPKDSEREHDRAVQVITAAGIAGLDPKDDE